MRKIYIYLPFLYASCFTFLISNAFSQNPVIVRGAVFDGQTMERLAGADVIIEEIERGTTTDDSGQFTFTNVPVGEFTLSASYMGYRVFKQPVITRDIKETSLTILLMPTILKGQSIEVTATRAREGESPVTFSNISREDIEAKYTASDIPMMLDELPGVYAYSLTGDNLGYSFLKIRGFDQSRIGVMINEIPLNDPEDQQVYWVDHPDLAESIQDIQVQRGVGSSIYGSSTFGGSVNINTKNYSSNRYARISLGGGSFNTRKVLAEFKSGLIENTYGFYGRISKISSDGYRRHSSSDLLSYFLGMERYDRDMVTRLNIFNGHERTHPDWDGVPETILQTDRRYKKESYENAVDDFTQPQIHLIVDWQISSRLNLTNTLYLVHGQGYYENLKINTKLGDYGMLPFETRDPDLFGADSLYYYETVDDTALYRTGDGSFLLKRSDLTRQKWVSKNQYGWIGKLTISLPDAVLDLGSSLYLFNSDHHGKVLWARYLQAPYSPERRYYEYDGQKTSLSLYANYLYDIYTNTKLLANMLYEHKTYNFKQHATALFQGSLLNRYEVTYNFYSPRMGINYTFSDELSAYANISYAQREPADNELFDTWTGPDDLGAAPLFAYSDTVRSGGSVQYVRWQDPLVQPESVVDYELGLTYRAASLFFQANLYYMDFVNEIVPLGGVNKDGQPVKGNADRTVHSGIEVSVAYTPLSFLRLNGNVSWSRNYYKKFIQNSYDPQSGGDDLSGNPIAGFPDLIGNFRITGLWKDLSGSLFIKYVGKQYLDNTNDEERIINPFTRTDLMLDYRLADFGYFPEIRLTFKVVNLFDEQYETAGYYDSWAGTAYLYPAACRNYYAGVSFSL